jgi:hypothetical protein
VKGRGLVRYRRGEGFALCRSPANPRQVLALSRSRPRMEVKNRGSTSTMLTFQVCVDVEPGGERRGWLEVGSRSAVLTVWLCSSARTLSRRQTTARTPSSEFLRVRHIIIIIVVVVVVVAVALFSRFPVGATAELRQWLRRRPRLQQQWQSSLHLYRAPDLAEAPLVAWRTPLPSPT